MKAASARSARLSLIVTSLLVFGLLARSVRAEPPAKDSQTRARVAIFLVPAKGFKPQVVAKVSRALVNALRKHPELDVEDSDKLLVQFSGEVPRPIIAQAKDALELGIKQLRQGETNEAVATLKQASDTFDQVLAFVKKKTVAKAHLALGVAQAEAGMKQEALTTIARLLTWRPHLRYDTDTFPPSQIPVFEKARQLVKKKKRGSMELTTTPPGAKAYVDGRFMGVTPTVAFGLKVGQHYATFKKMGYVKAAQKVEVSPRRQHQYHQQLKRSEKFLLLKQSLERAKQALGRSRANSAMVDLRSFLFIDQAVFATIGYGGPGKIYMQAYLYDLRTKLRLKQAVKTINQRTLAEIKSLARLLYLGVKTDGSLEAPPEAPPPPPKKRSPFYATWWFWTAVAAGVATAIIVPYYTWPRSETVGDGYLPPVGISN